MELRSLIEPDFQKNITGKTVHYPNSNKNLLEIIITD